MKISDVAKLLALSNLLLILRKTAEKNQISNYVDQILFTKTLLQCNAVKI